MLQDSFSDMGLNYQDRFLLGGPPDDVVLRFCKQHNDLSLHELLADACKRARSMAS